MIYYKDHLIDYTYQLMKNTSKLILLTIFIDFEYELSMIYPL